MGERESDLDHLTRRMRALGASDEEIDALRVVWDKDDTGWAIPRRDLVRLTDSALRALIGEARREFIHHMMSEDEENEANYRAAFERARSEADYVVRHHTTAEIVAWVKDGWSVRARVDAIRAAESERLKPRKSLLSALDGIDV